MGITYEFFNASVSEFAGRHGFYDFLERYCKGNIFKQLLTNKPI